MRLVTALSIAGDKGNELSQFMVFFCLLPLPPQVTPVNGSDWSEEAVSWFKATVYRRTFYARLYPQGPKVTVELFFEKGRLGAMRY